MIVYKNVCDYCSNEEIIDEESISFVVRFGVMPALKSVGNKYINLTDMSFCCRGCLCEWIKDNLKENGTLIEVGNGE